MADPFDLTGKYERRFPLIIWGKGYQGRFISEKNEITDERGVLVKPILIAPTEETKEIYKIKEEQLKVANRAMWVQYPVDMIDWLNQSPRDAVMLIWCAFNRGDTMLTRKMQGLFEKIQIQDKFINSLKISNAKLMEDNENLRQQNVDVIKKLQEMGEIFGMKKEDEEKEK